MKSPIAFSVVLGGVALTAIAMILLVMQEDAGSDQVLRVRPPVSTHERGRASREELARSIELGATYLDEHIDSDGRFEYRIDVLGRKLRPRYNVLRHAGSIYALGMYHDLSGDEAAVRTILLATKYLRERHLEKLEVPPFTHAIFSFPGEEVDDVRKAKLGGCGLALVAFLKAREIDTDAVTMEEVRGLARFILHMQRADGSFHSKWSEKKGFLAGFESLYYPGEAILGLTLLYRVDPDERWLRAAAEGAAYLVATRRNKTHDLSSDHWIMIAASHLLPVYDELVDPPISAEELRLHVIKLGNRMMQEQQETAEVLDELGPFVVDERSTPTATRLEGLVAMHDLLRAEEDALRSMVELSIEAGSAWLLRCQVRDGPGKGGFLRARTQIPDWEESFNRRQTEIRIDYVQHAISALIGAVRIRDQAGAAQGEPARSTL